MKREIIINVEQQEKRLAFLEDGLLEEYYFERQKNKRLKGSIMRGKVMRVLSSMEAAFVDIGLEKNGFLHVSDITDERIRDEDLLGEELDEVVPHRKSASRKITDFCNRNNPLNALFSAVHFPFHWAFLFSTKAVMPSFWSSVEKSI